VTTDGWSRNRHVVVERVTCRSAHARPMTHGRRPLLRWVLAVTVAVTALAVLRRRIGTRGWTEQPVPEA
jgi:hypothetical protein